MSLTDRPEGVPARDRARALRDAAEERPFVAAGAVGELIELVADHGGATREDAGAALKEIGKRAPASLGDWSGALADLAGADDDRAAGIGLRALAQLAAVDPDAVEPAVEPAIAGLDATDETARAAALSMLAELGDADPSHVAPADAAIADALEDPAPVVCSAAVMAAGRVLGADPTALPRTRERLVASVDGDGGCRRAALVYVAMASPGALPELERLATDDGSAPGGAVDE